MHKIRCFTQKYFENIIILRIFSKNMFVKPALKLSHNAQCKKNMPFIFQVVYIFTYVTNP